MSKPALLFVLLTLLAVASAEVEQCINSICYRNACGGAGAAVLSGDGCFCADGSPCEESAIVGNASSASSALFALFGVLLAMLA
mmetsp:Transcript_1259/g.4108  ORF Transcript_1259/g.4108 Transcript_1259/m.4108 type:complete len:84 (+) Transcript_1259:44-295(+)